MFDFSLSAEEVATLEAFNRNWRAMNIMNEVIIVHCNMFVITCLFCSSQIIHFFHGLFHPRKTFSSHELQIALSMPGRMFYISL